MRKITGASAFGGFVAHISRKKTAGVLAFGGLAPLPPPPANSACECIAPLMRSQSSSDDLTLIVK